MSMEAPRPGTEWHIGRSFNDTRLEDTCPCPKAPCGLVDSARVADDCPEHPWHRAKTIRQSHLAENCPARAAVTAARTHLHHHTNQAGEQR